MKEESQSLIDGKTERKGNILVEWHGDRIHKTGSARAVCEWLWNSSLQSMSPAGLCLLSSHFSARVPGACRGSAHTPHTDKHSLRRGEQVHLHPQTLNPACSGEGASQN